MIGNVRLDPKDDDLKSKIIEFILTIDGVSEFKDGFVYFEDSGDENERQVSDKKQDDEQDEIKQKATDQAKDNLEK